MPTSAVLGAVLIGISLPLTWWSVASGRSSREGGLLARFSKRGEATTDLRELALAESASRRVVSPALHGLAMRLRRITPAGYVDSTARRVRLAGIEARWPVERVLAAQFVVVGAAFVLGLAVLARSGAASGLASLGVLMFLALIGPLIVLDGKVKRRQDSIRRGLSDALDQITMAVEAGLGFEGAISRAAKAGKGPLAEEFGRVLKEMQIGVSRSEALRHVADRTEVIEMQTFVVSVIQAEEHGLPIAQVLRVQAAEMRVKRKLRAEESAMKLPVKMIFPLGLCIFPALFIVILGPGVIRIWRAFAI